MTSRLSIYSKGGVRAAKHIREASKSPDQQTSTGYQPKRVGHGIVNESWEGALHLKTTATARNTKRYKKRWWEDGAPHRKTCFHLLPILPLAFPPYVVLPFLSVPILLLSRPLPFGVISRSSLPRRLFYPSRPRIYMRILRNCLPISNGRF